MNIIALIKQSVRPGRARRTALLARADRARDAGQWREAAALYQRLLKAAPRRAGIWVQLGHCLKESGRRAEAEAAYRRSLTITPDAADTHLQLGHLLKIMGRTAEALSCYTHAVALDPNHEEAAREMRGLRALGVKGTGAYGLYHELSSRIDAIAQQMAHILTHVAVAKALAFELSRLQQRVERLEQRPPPP